MHDPLSEQTCPPPHPLMGEHDAVQAPPLQFKPWSQSLSPEHFLPHCTP
jgi:hypothetical protein